MPDALVRGWGRGPGAWVDLRPVPAEQLPGVLAGAGPRGVLVRGLGRSYGDAAANSGGIVLAGRALAGPATFDRGSGVLDAPAGASLAELLEMVLPLGWCLPVLPGTRFVTLGGALACDVHGKNHLRDGALSAWVQELTLLGPDGSRRRLEPADPAFAATVGGMGLTGVILSARLRCLPVPGPGMAVDTRRLPDLDAVLAQMNAPLQRRYQVAWVDCLHPSGRGVWSAADHAGPPGPYRPTERLIAPPAPAGLLRPATVRVFNEAWFRRAPLRREDQRATFSAFFHPLDGVRGWNRLYGPRGFLQYQIAVPDRGVATLPALMARLRAAGAAPFLAVLKRFGPATGGPLSFPLPGWSLAVDLALPGPPGLRRALDDLDELVAAAGGRVYLAKDARLRPDLLAAMYPGLAAWREVRERLDPGQVLRSDLGRRLALVTDRGDGAA